MQAVLTRFCARRAYNFPDVCVLLASNSKQALTSMGFRTAAFRLCRFSSAVHAPSSIERHIGWLVSTSIAQAFSFVKQKTTFCRLCRFLRSLFENPSSGGRRFKSWLRSQLRNSHHRFVSGFAENCTLVGISSLSTATRFAGLAAEGERGNPGAKNRFCPLIAQAS